MNLKQRLLRGRAALRRNTSFPRSSLRNKNWKLKTSKRNSSTPSWRKEAAGREGAWLEAWGELLQLHAWGGPGLCVCTALTSLSHSYLILLPRGSHGNGARRFRGKASMTARMEKRGGIWQASIFLHTKQCCLYSIPPRLSFVNTGLGTFQAPWTPGRGWCNLWTKAQ